MSSKVLQVHQESAIIFPAFIDFGGKCHLFNNLRIGTDSMLHSLMNKILSMQPPPSRDRKYMIFQTFGFLGFMGPKGRVAGIKTEGQNERASGVSAG
jgi:hypothetical protein